MRKPAGCKKIPKKRMFSFLAILFIILAPSVSYCWSAKTHTFIAEKCGIKNPDFANLPDLIREDNYFLYAPLHMHYAAPGARVTPEYIDRFKISAVRHRLDSGDQIEIRIPAQTGVLYWKIVDLYRKVTEHRGWEYQFFVFNIAHYIGDLSQPLHNYPWGKLTAGDGRIYPEVGAWSKDRHRAFDKAFEPYLPPEDETEEMLKRESHRINIESEGDLIKEICRIANSSIGLADRCYKENREMTKEETVRQISLSISFLKAVIANTKGNNIQLLEPPN